MGLEVDAGFIATMEKTWPLGGDFKKEGDNHIRMMKNRLQNTFPNADRAFQIPRPMSINSGTGVTTAFDNARVYVDTGVGNADSPGVTLALPALTTAENGLLFTVVKINNGPAPIRLTGPGGGVLINGLYDQIRRSVSSKPIVVTWNNGWFVDRQIGAPIGTCIPYFGPVTDVVQGLVAPIGVGSYFNNSWFELDQWVVSRFGPVNSGVLPDMKGRTFFGASQGTARVYTGAGGFPTGENPWEGGGEGGHTLTTAEIPAHDHTAGVGSLAISGSVKNANLQVYHAVLAPPAGGTQRDFAVRADGGAIDNVNQIWGSLWDSSLVGSVTPASVGSSGAHNNMPPGVIGRWLIVGE